MSDIQNKLVEIITQLQGIVKDNAADAVNLGLAAVKMNGVCWIMVGVVLLAIGLVCVFMGKKTDTDKAESAKAINHDEHDFIREFNGEMIRRQGRLGEKFEKVLFGNLWELYEE